METTTQLSIDVDRIDRELARLAEFSEVPSPAVTRVMLSPQDMAAREFLTGLFREAGLAVRTDPAGNMFARWEGIDAALPPVATGSHFDALPHGGRYDGTVGVLGGLEAIRALQRAGARPRRPIELIAFTSEESTRYGIGCFGSRIMAGDLAPEAAGRMTDDEGKTFEVLRREVGIGGSLTDVRLQAGYYEAFVELHIEQGPILEQEGTQIGVVTGIAAPAALRVQYEGQGGHAGTVLMSARRDALLPAAELALAVDDAARTLGGEDTVATTGLLHVHPGAVNSIPGRTTLEIDVRDVQHDRRDRVLKHIQSAAREIAARRQVAASVEIINADPPATCDERILAAVERACGQAGASCRRLVSRAYHDSLFMALLCPIGMIFVPCRDGVSHRPDEYASPEDIAKGAEVLAHTLAEFSEQTWQPRSGAGM